MKRALLDKGKGTKKRAALVPPTVPQRPRSFLDGLSEDQLRAVTLIDRGLSVFLSGEAGSGKSFVLKRVIEHLRAQNKVVAVVASTGVAASHFAGARTLHSLLHLKKESREELVDLVRTRFGNLEHWDERLYERYFLGVPKQEQKAVEHKTAYDELLDLLSESEEFVDPPVKPDPDMDWMQEAQKREQEERKKEEERKRKDAYFRTARLFKDSFDIDVLVVDEISMVSETVLSVLDYTARMVRGLKDIGVPEARKQYYAQYAFGGIQVIFTGDFYQLPPVNANYAFRSPAWHGGIHPVFLTTQHRQSQKNDLYRVISALRDNVFGRKDAAAYERREMVYGLLTSRVNAELEEIEGIEVPTLVSKNDEARTINETKQAQLELTLVQPYDVVLMTETQVELQKNPGFRGPKYATTSIKVLRLTAGTQVMCTCNMKVGTVMIHNGMVGRVVGFRTRPLDQSPVVYEDAEQPEIVRTAIEEWKTQNPQEPIVEFENGIECVVPGNVTETKSRVGNGYATVSVSVVPSLIACWAITIHKSQGATMTRARIVIENAFSASQIYVALSRVRSIEGVTIEGKLPSKANVGWMVKESVVQWVKQQKATEEEERNEEQALN